MKKIISIVGARPNFMKIAPIAKELKNYGGIINHMICHTGQHFDYNMSDVFFSEFGMSAPEINLGISGGSHAFQTAMIMMEFEKVCLRERPDLVIVVGDVNSTLACSLVAVKMGISVAHVESGLRSNDRAMPEEINRIVTDSISDYMFTTEKSGSENLIREGVSAEKIFFVGNVMIDSLVGLENKIKSSEILKIMKLATGRFILVTFHRPSNVDNNENLLKLLAFLNLISIESRVIFPIHPRTRKNIVQLGYVDKLSPNIILIDPIGYIDFQCLVRNSAMVITDSGGIQEETTFLGIQCITVRDNTERPVTVEIGTNHLVGINFESAETAARNILSGKIKPGKIPDLWDGHAATRIVSILADLLDVV